MKKLGFTLAEILITLGIIGVVAALTMPGLVTGSRNSQYSSALRVAVSNIENAFRTAISEEGTDSLFSTRMWANAPIKDQAAANANFAAFVGNLGTYLAIDHFETISAATYYSNRNAAIHDMSANGSVGDVKQFGFGGDGVAFPIELKTGATMFIRTFARKAADNAARKNQIINLGGTLYDNAADIFIDVNGVKPPNTLGRDIFSFYLAGNGTLHAVGSTSVAIYDDLNAGNTWNGNGTYSCTNAVKGAGGVGCTGRLISNGYEFDY